jgi:hypothetical protein
VAKVKAAARPWRSIFLLVLAVAMATLSRSARTAAASEYFSDTAYRALGHTGAEALSDAAAVAFCLLAYLGTTGLAGRAREVLEPKIGTSHAAVIRYTIVLFGGLATILITLQLFGIGIIVFPAIVARGCFTSALMAPVSRCFAGRAQYSTTMRSSTSVTPGADHTAATASSCSAHELTAPATITVP